MDDAAVIYLKTFHDQTKFYGTWFPGLRIKVGEIGRLDGDGVYHYSTDLAQVGIDFEKEKFPYQNVHFATEGSVDVSGGFEAQTKAAISAVAKAEGAFTISFSTANSVAVILRELEVERVKNEERLRREMLAAWQETPRRLETDHVVITKVFKAKSGAIAMSGDSSARVGATTSASLVPGTIELAEIKGNLSIVASEHARFAIAAEEGDPPLTPMFEMLHFAKNRPFWRFWRPVIAPATRALADVPDFDDSNDPGEIVGLDQLHA